MGTHVRLAGHPSWFPSGERWESRWEIHDSDSRRWVLVTVVDHAGLVFEDQPDYDNLVHLIHETVSQRIDDGLSPDIVAIRMKANGEVLSMSTDPGDDATCGTYYAPKEVYQLPEHVRTIVRSDLTEVARLSAGVDLVSYEWSPSGVGRKVVFKHYEHHSYIPGIWHEVQILARLPPHPSLVPIDYLVLEEVNRSGVVGFILPYIANGTLNGNRSARPFKLKWLKQLLQVIDDLHLKFGIAHRDVAPRNLMVDPATDNLLLIDFGMAKRIGIDPNHKPGEEIIEQAKIGVDEDIKGVMLTVHDLVTMNGTEAPWYIVHKTDADLQAIKDEKWVKHPDVRLNGPVDKYREMLMSWVRKRRSGPQIAHYSLASEPLDFSDSMPIPEERDTVQETVEQSDEECTRTVPVNGPLFRRHDALRFGRSFVGWERPPKAKLDRTRRLLATGKYADGDEHGGSNATKSRSKPVRRTWSTKRNHGGGDILATLTKKRSPSPIPAPPRQRKGASTAEGNASGAIMVSSDDGVEDPAGVNSKNSISPEARARGRGGNRAGGWRSSPRLPRDT